MLACRLSCVLVCLSCGLYGPINALELTDLVPTSVGKSTAFSEREGTTGPVSHVSLNNVTVQGCSLHPRDIACPSDKLQRFVNGDGLWTPSHTAYIGKGDIGRLPVPPGSTACCRNDGNFSDYLFVNPQPGSAIPTGCEGTGAKFPSNVLTFTLIEWIAYAPSGQSAQCVKGCTWWPWGGPEFCIPKGLMSVPGVPSAFFAG